MERPFEELPSGNGKSEELAKRLDSITEFGVNMSAFAFLGLQVPQIMQNFLGDPAEMADLSWSGYVSGSMGNLLLCTYFASVSEWAQTRVQIIGALTNYFVATQIYIAGYFPAPQFWTLVFLISIGVLVPILFAGGCISAEKFDAWKEATTPIGLAGLIFSITSTFTESTPLLLTVALVGLALGILMLTCKTKVAFLEPLMATMGGWMATFLFMWMPLPQIFNILAEGKKAAEAFNLGFTVLATIGNGLGSTRAFVIKNQIWMVGSFWGLMVGGWVNAVCVWKENPEQCPLLALVPYTAFLVLYFAMVLKFNGDAKHESAGQQAAFIWRA